MMVDSRERAYLGWRWVACLQIRREMNYRYDSMILSRVICTIEQSEVSTSISISTSMCCTKVVDTERVLWISLFVYSL